MYKNKFINFLFYYYCNEFALTLELNRSVFQWEISPIFNALYVKGFTRIFIKKKKKMINIDQVMHIIIMAKFYSIRK